MCHPRFLLICFGVVLAAGSWGLYWVPQRAFEQAGMTGGWGTLAQSVGCVLLLLPVAVWRWRRGDQTGLDLPVFGLLMGGGFVCYANSLLLTDVVRALLLFYLVPVWATLIEIVFLKRRQGWRRSISLSLSLIGVWIVLGKDAGLPLPENLGDWLAITGGAVFAGGVARADAMKIDSVFPVLFAFFVYGSVVAIAQAAFFGVSIGPVPSADAWFALLPWLALFCLVFFIPTMAMTAWAPQHVGTGLVSILFLAELLFGTVSAALWADEPFGWHEAVGSTLILLAGVLEVALPTPVKAENAT
ncbi:MAG: DMT family transporter [Rhodospirillales bacterium]